jgi:LemA protein
MDTKIALLLVGLLLLLVVIYNRLVRDRLRVREAWSGVDVQLKRRADLVPNLVSTVQGYAAHERATFEQVTNARAALQLAAAPGPAAAPNQELSRGLVRLLAVAENYPQLRASEQFIRLQEELVDVEEKLSYARQFYNRNVLGYNTRLDSFPQVLLGPVLGFRPAEFFEAEEPDRSVVSVSASSGQKV